MVTRTTFVAVLVAQSVVLTAGVAEPAATAPTNASTAKAWALALEDVLTSNYRTGPLVVCAREREEVGRAKGKP
jgi:hypothetical protein